MNTTLVTRYFDSIEFALAAAEPGAGLRIFATMARAAGAFVINKQAEKQIVVDTLREIAVVYGLPQDHGEDAVQQAIVAAIEKPFDRERFERERPGPRPMSIITPDTLDGRPAPKRLWEVPDLIPARTVTILNGDGGTGKSLLALQLAAAKASRQMWLGQSIAWGKVLFLSCEDEIDEIHRRLVDVAADLGVSLADLADLMIVPLAGEDAILAAQDGGSDLLKTTARWVELEAMIADQLPALVVLDTLADIFAGKEISRSQARQFINLLRGLALRHSTTVLLLAHPSLSGMATGTGSSGSTAWNNSVRSRLYLTRVTLKDDKRSVEPDVDRRILSTMKANYAPTGNAIALRWSAGVFKLDDAPASALAAAPANALHDLAFIDMLERYRRQSREVSPMPSANYAPKIFADDATSNGIGKKALVATMNRLLADGRIAIEEFGPPSKLRKRLIVVQT